MNTRLRPFQRIAALSAGLVASAALLTGCPAEEGPRSEVTMAPRRPQSGAVEAAGTRVAELGPGEVLLDDRDGTWILGWIAPAIADSDPDRVLVLQSNLGAGLGAALNGARVLDARIVDSGVVVLETGRVLRLYTADGSDRPLVGEVYGPLAVSGDTVACVVGAPPDLELARVDVRTGAVEQLTHELAPVWSPALSPDGAEVVFVSGAEGAPRLFRRDAAGTLHRLPKTVRVPSAASAPRWRGQTLVFEDEAGVAFLDLGRGTVLGEVPGARALATRDDGTIAASVNGRLQTLEIPGGGR